MPLLPDEVSSKTFRRWGRGYDRHQVEAFLRAAASDYGAAISRVAALAEERTRALADNEGLRNEIDALARSVRDGVDSGRSESEWDVEATHRRAEQEAAAITRQAAESAAERRMDQCIQQTDRALGTLRARVALLDQVDEVQQLIATIRADVQAICTQPRTPTNSAEATTS